MSPLPPQPLSPLDGRYRASVEGLGEHLSEAGLNRARVHVEVEWLLFLADRGTFGAEAPTEADQSKVQLLMSFDPEQSGTMDVPDPYYSDAAMFDTVLLAIERASNALFRQLEPAIRQGVS